MTLHQATESVLLQLKIFVTKLTEEEYAKPLALLSENTIGKHVRHIIEFYECLTNTIEFNTPLDYDKRQRNLIYENYPQKVSDAIDSILERLGSNTHSSSISLLFMTSAEEGNKTEIQTSIERELAYNIEHAIHHMAIIKIAVLYYFSKIELQENFGIAPSTIKYNVQSKNLIEE